mmetsp:Transcript_3884/g.9403  ORF Transcript_3884/g.9403 Transcript_3884/m.9403 type:complete len:481 (-) Transcript_3884:117-1559(-)
MGLCSSVPGGKGKKVVKAKEKSKQDGSSAVDSDDGDEALEAKRHAQRCKTGYLINENMADGVSSVVLQAVRNSRRADANNMSTPDCVANAADVLFCDVQRPDSSASDNANADAAAAVSAVATGSSALPCSSQTCSGGASRGFESDVEAVLHEIERIVDQEYDVLLAELLLEKVIKRLSSEDLAEVLSAPVIERMKRKLDYLKTVGQACCCSDDVWFSVYKDGAQSIDGFIDKSDASVLHYKARITIPASLKSVMAVANEVDLMPTWNKLVVGTPEVIGRRTAHYMVLHYQMSMLGGMYKVDLLNEVRRFSDPRGGFLAEYIRSADGNHPCYSPPGSGFKRPTTEVKNVWVACGENSTVLIQVGKLKLPFSATKWLASSIGGIAGRFIVGGLMSNSLKASETGNPWEKRVEVDESGLYRRLSELVASRGSVDRMPTTGISQPSFKDADLEPYFQRGDVLELTHYRPAEKGKPGRSRTTMSL